MTNESGLHRAINNTTGKFSAYAYLLLYVHETVRKNNRMWVAILISSVTLTRPRYEHNSQSPPTHSTHTHRDVVTTEGQLRLRPPSLQMVYITCATCTLHVHVYGVSSYMPINKHKFM